MEVEQVRGYLGKYNIKTPEKLVQHISELKKNTTPNISLISELAYVLEDFYFYVGNKENTKEAYKETEGIKESNGKADYSEINLEILDLMAERFTANKHKYSKGNMKKTIDVKSLEWALFRHVKKMIQPIETDEETYKDHLSAVLCNASMILDQLKNSR